MRVAPLPLIRLVGRDGDDILFSVKSFTRPEIIHEITFYGKEFVVKCSCEDAVCRRKVKDLLDDKSQACKHVRSLLTYVLPVLRKNGLLKTT